MRDLVEASIMGPFGQFEYDLPIEIEGHICQVYEVSIAYRDILLFTDHGTATFLVDTYGSRHTFELYDTDFSD